MRKETGLTHPENKSQWGEKMTECVLTHFGGRIVPLELKTLAKNESIALVY